MAVWWEESRQIRVTVRFTMAFHSGLALAVIQALPEPFFWPGVYSTAEALLRRPPLARWTTAFDRSRAKNPIDSVRFSKSASFRDFHCTPAK
jgi:hypothetical protein